MQSKLITDRAALFIGDAAHVGEVLAPDSVDAIVTDPPAGISFMDAEWDGDKGGRDAWIAWLTAIMTKALHVLKPGGHALVWAIPRTAHWTATALENAGFEVRDVVTHLFGSGFPKSLDVSKAIDKQRQDDPRPVCRFLRAAMDARGVNSRAVSERFGFHSRMVDHWAARDTDSQPTVPTWDQWLALKTLLAFGDTMDGEVWRLNARKGTLGEAWQAREVTGQHESAPAAQKWIANYGHDADLSAKERRDNPASPAAVEWQGWGTALKPAAEFWILCRKPLIGTVAANVQTWRTGGLNIDACRIPTSDDRARADSGRKGSGGVYGESETYTSESHPGGRWPANVTLDERAAELLDAQSGVLTSGANPTRRGPSKSRNTYKDTFAGQEECSALRGEDSGGASRFYYVAKPSRAERDAGCDELPVRSGGQATGRADGSAGLKSPRAGAGRGGNVRNHHPTVKSIALMRWLCRLITPPGGAVLDLFAGSGSTGVAALAEGFEFIGIEMDPDFAEIASARLRHAHG